MNFWTKISKKDFQYFLCSKNEKKIKKNPEKVQKKIKKKPKIYPDKKESKVVLKISRDITAN